MIAFSCNYLANIPEIIDAREGDEGAPAGHFRLRRRAQRLVRRRGDPRTRRKALSTACCAARARPGFRCCSPRSRAGGDLADVPGVVTADGEGPPPGFVHSLDDAAAGARPAAPSPTNISSACSTRAPRSSSRAAVRGIARSAAPGPSTAAATGWSARSGSIEDLRAIREPGVFIVDDVAFVHERHGFELGEAVARAGIKKELLPGNPRRRAAAQQGGVPLLEEARRRLHVSRARGDRRGGSEEIPQARAARAQFRGARIRPLARHPPRDQPDRRSRLGPRAVPRPARVVPRTARDRQYQRQHALSRHRELADRGAPAADARLPPVRHPARGIADPAAARRVLRGAGRRHSARSTRKHLDWRERLGRARHRRPGCCCAARPISSRACSSSTASIAPTCCSPIMHGRSRTRSRCRRRPRTPASDAPAAISIFMRRAAAPDGRSTPRPSPLSTRRGWAPRRRSALRRHHRRPAARIAAEASGSQICVQGSRGNS